VIDAAKVMRRVDDLWLEQLQAMGGRLFPRDIETGNIVKAIVEAVNSDRSTLAQGWQPIATAPKSELVLTFAKGRGTSLLVCSLARNGQDLWFNEEGDIVPVPSHWMPLPDPPEVKR